MNIKEKAGLTAMQRAEWIASQSEEEQFIIFMTLPQEAAGKIFECLPLYIQKRLLKRIPRKDGAVLLKRLTPDDRTALLQGFPKKILEELLKLLPLDERAETVMLLGYPKGSVGRLMTPDYLTAKEEWSVGQVLNEIQAYGGNSETIDIVYVINAEGKLLDDIQLRDFLFAPSASLVSAIADYHFLSLSVDENDETAIQLFRQYDRGALPVLDESGVLLGIVTIDDILRLSDQEATEDIQKMGGTQALDEPYMDAPFMELMRKRAGWLVVLFLGETLTATAMAYFADEISKAVVLALFLPLIISSGGNAGSQASTLIIRAMALGEVKLKDWWKVIRREFYAGIFLGTILGTIGFFRVSLWSTFTDIYGQHWLLLAATIFLSLIGVVTWGTFSGACLPLILRKLGADPATSSAPFVATIVDVVGVLIYFMVALWVLKGVLL